MNALHLSGPAASRAREGRTAVFFGGVVPASAEEEALAEDIGRTLAQAGYSLLHGGYNGLMEAAARGAGGQGATVTAVTLLGKHDEWGAFNRHATISVHLPDLGARLNYYLEHADLIVAMGGGVGTLHELTAALYYATTIRPVPVFVTGPTALRLLAFLREEKWLFETPTRSLGFLSAIESPDAFRTRLATIDTAPIGGA
ncbi:DNA transporter [Streptacidiphilus sp. PB12-B1b]|uniref:SLOG cluster 4 domain-containing protein n=1 Tax=Streptacidiphilus sp. PB12-B1b TaxID=2705012 RepID=UPI0015FB7A84|nr:LOG family protein [Streptacidiphilus sp. PB12-B1b]QMU74595.1 DNA transporter [Streptacidiphilus sp. PB12-B1b]